MASRLGDASSALNDLIKKSIVLTSGPPAVRRLLTTRSNLDESGKIRKWTFGQIHSNMQNKTILLVGETGTGKTTLINTMVNYYLSVKFEDKVWFEITEEQKKDQTESQTSEITVYEIFSEQKPESLTIIDTPGYGDTRGIDKDMKIAENLHKLFLHETGMKSLDAVCLVLKSSQNRISDRLHYIFEGVLSLFGKDIKDIVVLLLTHSDGGPPTNALEAFKKEKIPCCHDDENQPVHFLFNNRQSEKYTAKYEQVFRSSCEMGERSLKEFFEFLESHQSKSLTLTVSVLQERMQLEACVESLKEQILFKEKKQGELKNVQEALKQNKENIEHDGNFPFTVKIAYKELVGTWFNITRCDNCRTNCHQYFCWTAESAQDCRVMKNGNCTGCKCDHSKHVREQKKYQTKEKTDKVTFEVLKQKYIIQKEGEVTFLSNDKTAFENVDKGHDNMLKMKEDMIKLETSLMEELCKNEQEMNNLVKKAYKTIMQLSEIALKPDSVFTIQYLDFLIPRVKKAEKREWVQKLEELRKTATKESTKSAMGYLRYARDYMREKCGFTTQDEA